MNVFQKTITLKSYPRGCHLITKDIERALKGLPIRVGLCHVFLKHTSAGLTINENADPSVRADLEEYLNRVAPENAPYFTHDYEGPDDMPAHIKSSLFGCSVTIPLHQIISSRQKPIGLFMLSHNIQISVFNIFNSFTPVNRRPIFLI